MSDSAKMASVTEALRAAAMRIVRKWKEKPVDMAVKVVAFAADVLVITGSLAVLLAGVDIARDGFVLDSGQEVELSGFLMIVGMAAGSLWLVVRVSQLEKRVRAARLSGVAVGVYAGAECGLIVAGRIVDTSEDLKDAAHDISGIDTQDMLKLNWKPLMERTDHFFDVLENHNRRKRMERWEGRLRRIGFKRKGEGK